MSLDELVIIEQAASHAPLEMRAAVETIEVRHPERVVTMIAVPYDTETPIYRNGEWIVETVSPHAFDGVEHRARKVKVNRGHDVERTVGRALALHPAHPKHPGGLVAELRISRTPLGDESLELLADGALDASVGFAPMTPGGETWSEHRSRRRIERAYLGHIALVPNPAYDTANVIDVRAAIAPEAPPAESATPRLDEVLARLAALGYHPRPE